VRDSSLLSSSMSQHSSAALPSWSMELKELVKSTQPHFGNGKCMMYDV
jgi:hypothetical protein